LALGDDVEPRRNLRLDMVEDDVPRRLDPCRTTEQRCLGGCVGTGGQQAVATDAQGDRGCRLVQVRLVFECSELNVEGGDQRWFRHDDLLADSALGPSPYAVERLEGDLMSFEVLPCQKPVDWRRPDRLGVEERSVDQFLSELALGLRGARRIARTDRRLARLSQRE
jgi:hypothetical protein